MAVTRPTCQKTLCRSSAHGRYDGIWKCFTHSTESFDDRDDAVSFVVWRKDRSDADALPFLAISPKRAAEKRAREDWIAGHADWPSTYCVRDGVSGTIWAIDVTIATQPSFVAYEVREIEMPAATHVLWGGRTLCEDLRLCCVPGDWPAGQRWISLKDVADGVRDVAGNDVDLFDRFALPDRCAECWAKVPTRVDELREIGRGS